MIPFSGAMMAGAAALTPSLPRYTIIDDYEATTSRSVANGTQTLSSSRKISGTNALVLQGNGAGDVITTQNPALFSGDFAGQDLLVIGYNVQSQPGMADLSRINPIFIQGGSTYSYQYDTSATGTTIPTHNTIEMGNIGNTFASWSIDRFRITNFAGAKLNAAGASSRTSRVQLTSFGAGIGSRAPNVAIDTCMLVKARYKPIVMVSADDLAGNQYSLLYPLAKARRIPLTIYVPWDNIGAAGGISQAQLLEMQNEGGCGMCLDSAGDDKPITAFADVAAAIAQLNTGRNTLKSIFGAGRCEDHLEFSYNMNAMPVAPQTVANCSTTSGSNVVTVGGNAGYTQAVIGMYVFHANFPAGTVVTGALSPSQITVSNNATGSTSTASITFSGGVAGVAVTCNGTTTINMSGSGINKTDFMRVGMEFTGYTVPAGTTITAINSASQFVVSNAVPATCTLANVNHHTAPFYRSNIADALIANGYKSALHSAYGGIYTGLGLPDPQRLMHMGYYAIDNGLTACTAYVDQAIAEGTDIELNGHFGAWDGTLVTAVLDMLVAKRDAGLIDIMHRGDWYNAVRVRPRFPGT